MNSDFDKVNLLAPDCDSENPLLHAGAEEVRNTRLGQKDLEDSCLGRREVGESRLRWRELGGSMPTIRYKEGRLHQVVRDRARTLPTGTEGAWRQASTKEPQLLKAVRGVARRLEAVTERVGVTG